MSRVKKILECVCLSCAKLKADSNDPRFEHAEKLRDPKARLRAVWEICKGRMVCEGGDELADGTVAMDEYGGGNGVAAANGGLAAKKKSSHGGCGSRQPTIRKDGLKFVATYKSANADVSIGRDHSRGTNLNFRCFRWGNLPSKF